MHEDSQINFTKLLISKHNSILLINGVQFLRHHGQPVLLLCHGNTAEDPVVAAAEFALLIMGKVGILRDLGIVDSNGIVIGDPVHGISHILPGQGYGSLCNNVALAVTDQDFHRDARVVFGSVSHVHQCAGNAVGDFIGGDRGLLSQT